MLSLSLSLSLTTLPNLQASAAVRRSAMQALRMAEQIVECFHVPTMTFWFFAVCRPPDGDMVAMHGQHTVAATP